MIKVTLGEVKPQEEKQFPKIKIHKDSGRIVLFTSLRCGVQLNNVDKSLYIGEIGEYSDCWAFDIFTDYNEPVTIQNA